jgi:hypothetical protein
MAFDGRIPKPGLKQPGSRAAEADRIDAHALADEIERRRARPEEGLADGSRATIKSASRWRTSRDEG